jgi:hypothetical protein
LSPCYSIFAASRRVRSTLLILCYPVARAGVVLFRGYTGDAGNNMQHQLDTAASAQKRNGNCTETRLLNCTTTIFAGIACNLNSNVVFDLEAACFWLAVHVPQSTAMMGASRMHRRHLGLCTVWRNAMLRTKRTNQIRVERWTTTDDDRIVE